MRKPLTQAQIAARDARRDKMKALWKRVSEMPELERVQLANRAGIVTCEGHPLSPINQCLTVFQCSNASIVGGFRQWIKNGRCVKKGEHGIGIWVPTGTRKAAAADAPEVFDPASETTAGGDVNFIFGTVFDISQTIELEAQERAIDVQTVPQTENAMPLQVAIWRAKTVAHIDEMATAGV